MFRTVMGRFFWTTYDHMGRLAAANFCFGVLILGPFALVDVWPSLLWPCCLYSFVAGAILQTAMTAFAMDMRQFRDPPFRAFLAAIRRRWRAGLAAHLTAAGLLAILCVNIRFWSAPPVYPHLLKWPGMMIAGLCVWASVFVGLCYLFLLPALVEKELGLWAAWRQAAWLALDNVLPALGAAMTLAVLEAVGAVMLIGLALFCSAVLATMSSALYTTALYKYRRMERQAAAQAHGQRKPASWKQILERGGTLPGSADAQSPADVDGEPRRSFRELWRPWDA